MGLAYYEDQSMVKIKLKELFKFSPDGIEVVEYEAGEHELSIRGAECALEAEVVADVAGAKKALTAAKKAAGVNDEQS